VSSEEKKHLESILKPTLKELGFRKKGGTWWNHSDDYIQVISIQGSSYQKVFYINLGVYIREIGNNEWPAELDCHIRIRLNSYIDNNEINDLLNYEDYEPDELSREKLLTYIQNDAIEWLNKCSSISGAKDEYALPGRIMAKHQKEVLDSYFENR